MRKKYIFGKKLYISVLTSILVLLTTVATTFAWVGVFANSTFENFTFDVHASKLRDYNIVLSLTGDEDSFSSTISFDDIKKTILKNIGYTDSQLSSKEKINALFVNHRIEQCTTVPVLNSTNDKIVKLGDFKAIKASYDGLFENTKNYYCFDLYITVDKATDINQSSDFLLDVFLSQNMLSGNARTKTLYNPFTYDENFINPLIASPIPNMNITPIVGGQTMNSVKVDSASAARVAFEKYKVVDRGHPEQYNSTSSPISTIIYQDSYEYPYIDNDTGVTNLGAILDDEINLATGYWNSFEWRFVHQQIFKLSLNDPEHIAIKNTRSVNGSVPDVVLSKETNHLIDSTVESEQISTSKMMKIKVYFWFEGWDADCMGAINNSIVNINLGFMTNKDDEE